MNIKSIKYIGAAVLLGAALNSSSFAGPGPRPIPVQHNQVQQQSYSERTVTQTPSKSSTSIALTGHDMDDPAQRTPVFIPTPHGTVTISLK